MYCSNFFNNRWSYFWDYILFCCNAGECFNSTVKYFLNDKNKCIFNEYFYTFCLVDAVCYWGLGSSLWHWDDCDCLKSSVGMNQSLLKHWKQYIFVMPYRKSGKSQNRASDKSFYCAVLLIISAKKLPWGPPLSVCRHSFTSIYLSSIFMSLFKTGCTYEIHVDHASPVVLLKPLFRSLQTTAALVQIYLWWV